ncbi:MAG: sodium-translocating pyrophosphatase [Planctomycetes bacterium]|nr:sodium-translocating pyrophosphatase [Planctomycetota bacterium]
MFVLTASVIALGVAAYFFSWMKQQDPGNERMIRIAGHVQAGAMAYLKQQYKVVSVFFVVVALILAFVAFGLDAQSRWVPFAFLTGGFFSGLAGFFGMRTATWASNRTAAGAQKSLNQGLQIAFRSGAVMGLTVVGLGLLDIAIWFGVLYFGFPEMGLVEITVTMLCFGMGASSQALFARVGGGIFTKAADVGADLVGKVEAGIPEDDARNPATIADNVGDNVGDVAGMGADLYESYCGSILATAALGVSAAQMLELGDGVAVRFLLAPLILAAVGILLSVVGVFFVRTKEGASLNDLLWSLRLAIYGSSGLIAVAAFFVLDWVFKGIDIPNFEGNLGLRIFGSVLTGLVAGCVIGYFTEYFTAYEYAPTQRISKAGITGEATVIIAGVAEGMMSTWIPISVVGIGTILAYGFAGGFEATLDPILGLYGVGFAAVGMLATLGITLATDAYGPIADNAGGNAEMSHLDPSVRKKTDQLDSLGNTTAATGKGFAIGSAALTALALLAAYIEEVRIGQERDARDAASTHGGVGAWVIVEGTPESPIRLAHVQDDAKKTGEVYPLDKVTSFLVIRGESTRDITFEQEKLVPTATGEITPFTGLDQKGEEVTINVPVGYGIINVARARLGQFMTFYDVNLMRPNVLVGMFFGVLLVFTFCAMTMKAVGRAAMSMITEVRRQFTAIRAYVVSTGKTAEEAYNPDSWPQDQVHFNGEDLPNYAHCVAISTAGAQREMIVPSLMAVVVPIAVGLVLGVSGVMGLLAGGLVSGFAVAIFMANAGGAWDNAKKNIENGNLIDEKTGQPYKKGSLPHKATVVGDTVGDPFKDTSGPSLNILIKLMSMVSVVFAGLIVKLSPIIGAWLGIN